MNSRKKIYFMGIGGTGMASVAGLCKSAKFEVSGCDKELYPPMSTMLEELKIQTFCNYSKNNLQTINPDLVVVGNNISRGNVELEYVLEHKIPYTSFPAFLEDHFLSSKRSVVVAGTHGKTTTSSLVAFILDQFNENPSYFIGGIPSNFQRSFKSGSGSLFVIEGDEYDTCFFDKGSKFLHYKPKYVLINNLEFDHADIFANLEAVEKTFKQLLNLVSNPKNIIANIDDLGVEKILRDLDLLDKVTRIGCKGRNEESAICLNNIDFNPSTKRWNLSYSSRDWGDLKFNSIIGGAHNAANIAMAVGCLQQIAHNGELKHEFSKQSLSKSIEQFASVKRRFDHLGCFEGIDVYEDFAHHPTAVETVIESFRLSYPKSRLIVAFEPKNSSSRRNIFSDRYAAALKTADVALIAPCLQDQRIAASERLNTSELAKSIGVNATAFCDNQDLLAWLRENSRAGDSVVFMSCGSFSGIPQAYCQYLDSATIGSC